MENVLEIMATTLAILALVAPFVVLVAHRRTHLPYDPWSPAGNGSWRPGEPDRLG